MLPNDNFDPILTQQNQLLTISDPIIQRQSSRASASNDELSPTNPKKLNRSPRSLSLPWELAFLQPNSKRHLLHDDNNLISNEYLTSPQQKAIPHNQVIQFKGKNIIRKHITILRIVQPKSIHRLKYQRFYKQKEKKYLQNSKNNTTSENIINSIQTLISKNSSMNINHIRTDLIQISNGLNQLISHLENISPQQSTNIRSASPNFLLGTPPTPPLGRQNSRTKQLLQQQLNTPSPVSNKSFLRGNLANLRSYSVSNSITQNSPLSIQSPQQNFISSPLNIEKQMIVRSNDKNEKPSTNDRKAAFKSSSSYHQLEDTG